MYTVDNAIIMAAGTSSRFAPLSQERPKALISIKGEVLIERQIRQLRQAGIRDIYVVTGYKADMLQYLAEDFGVHLRHNPDYLTRNNNSSIYAVRDVVKNSYICSADNYFPENPFTRQVEHSYYAAQFARGTTGEWCMTTDENDLIQSVSVGGEDAWYMLGHAFWSENFSKTFVDILEREYWLPETADMFWENIYINHMAELPMKICKYPEDAIFEFDTLDELRTFDSSYIYDTRSDILRSIAAHLRCTQQDITQVTAYKDGNNAAAGFTFRVGDTAYSYAYSDRTLRRCKP